MNDVLVVIPARWGSERFPGKALADLGGRPLVVRVAERASAMTTATDVVVATDDQRILAAVTAAGFKAVLTGNHPSGSDRVAEVAAGRFEDIIVNLQGDEPLLDPADADALVNALRDDLSLGIATLAHRFADRDEWLDPNAVKVLSDDSGRALLFTRMPVPGRHAGRGHDSWQLARRHVGIYAYRRAALDRFLANEPHPLELAEGLEQLRALAAGEKIQVIETARRAVGVDTPEDLDVVRVLWNET